ncbi:Ldh family oxidoreductase [Geomicrobium sp. JCM 19055]|uniref:Ldh family oxidoreductase n=1 Tax=Geomicrobium sp. JCM 19055 TaxID=1460649 RepID=UPI002236B6EC|nr:Ldh family oxidoreductase [Geomicrobium sp. JCM 19055]
MNKEVRYYSVSTLTKVSTLLLKAGGLNTQNATTIAQDLVAANLRGIDSHGVSRIPMYLERIRKKSC